MSDDAMCSCGHIESAHRKMTNPACLAPTGYAFGAFSFGCSCTTFEAVSPGEEFRGPRNTIEGSDELHDSPMFSAAVKESGSRTCANPGLSAPILSTPIVSTTVTPLAPLPRPQVTTSGALSASALRSTPIPGDIAGGYTACKHGFTPECTFCWNERRRLNGQSTVDTAEPYRNQHASDNATTVAIQADEQTMSTDSASNDYERSVVTDDEMVEFERAKRDTITTDDLLAEVERLRAALEVTLPYAMAHLEEYGFGMKYNDAVSEMNRLNEIADLIGASHFGGES